MLLFRPASTLEKRTRTHLLLGLALASLLGLGLWLGPQRLPPRDQTLPVSTCDLNQGACSVRLPGKGVLQVEIAPRPIPVLKPLQIQARLGGLAATGVQVDFSGVEMDMGFNQIRLKPTAPGQFAGQGNLPICVTGAMNWQVSFLIEAPGGTLAVPFRFTTGN